MWPRCLAKFHPTAPLLHLYSTTGCPTNCGLPWSDEHIHKALTQGNHPSANSPTALKYMQEEAQGKINLGFATSVHWKDIKHALPVNFKLSPAAMIPHKSRKF